MALNVTLVATLTMGSTLSVADSNCDPDQATRIATEAAERMAAQIEEQDRLMDQAVSVSSQGWG